MAGHREEFLLFMSNVTQWERRIQFYEGLLLFRCHRARSVSWLVAFLLCDQGQVLPLPFFVLK